MVWPLPPSGDSRFEGTWEHMDVQLGDTVDINDYDDIKYLLIHTESPIAGGVTFRLRAVELDPWPNPDEDLGEEVVGPQDNEQMKQFFHDDDEALEVTLGWEVEDDNAGSSGGESGSSGGA